MRSLIRRCRWPVITAAAFAGGLTTGLLSRSGQESATTVRPAATPASAAGNGAPVVTAAEASRRLPGVLSVMDPAERNRRLRELARAGCASDPAAAWALQFQIAGIADREEFSLEVLRQWPDPDAAFRAAAALPSGRLRTLCAAAALERIAGGDPQAALVFAAADLTGAAQSAAFTAIVRGWANRAPADAAHWALQNLSVPAASGALRAAVQSWADSDPAAASQWVAGLPPGDHSAAACTALVESWAEQTPAEAAAWISAQGVNDSLDGAAAALALQWSARDPRAAMDWAVTLPRTSTARTATAGALAEWAALAPVEAARWLAETSPDLEAIAPALHHSLGTGWAAQDPAAAAAWVEALPDIWARRETAPAVFNTWAANDAAGLGKWIAENPASPVADAAREQLALSHSDRAPATALDAALQVSAPQAAAGLGRRILLDWQSRDLAAAMEWAAAHPQAAQFLQPQP